VLAGDFSARWSQPTRAAAKIAKPPWRPLNPGSLWPPSR